MHIIIRWTIIEEEILGQDHKKVISEEEVSLSSNNSSNLGNGNLNFSRNGSMNNIHNVEKTMQKFQQLAKDAQSNGDPVLAQNYLQHADHYLRRYNDLNERRESLTEKIISEDKSQVKVDNTLEE